MRSTATTVEGYLAEQTPEQREALAAIRRVIRANLDPEFREVVQYGMIGYVVPHERFPAGYHCNPREPLPFAGLGAQKQSISLHAMFLYAGADELRSWFTEAYAASGKKLDMGAACIRWKKLDDVPLDVVGALFARVSCAGYIARYEAQLAERRGGAKQAPAKPATKATSNAAKKSSPKTSEKRSGKAAKTSSPKTAKKTRAGAG